MADAIVDNKSGICGMGLRCLCWMLLSAVAVASWPVDVLEIHLAGGSRQPLIDAEKAQEALPLFSAAAPLGRGYETRIIHSVQLTPVVDRYRILEGRIWGWQELVLSHNAGLPYARPERGRFGYQAPWMLVEGGGASWSEVRYRVGTGRLGKNAFYYPSAGVAELWRDAPGMALSFAVRRQPFAARLLRHECRLGFAFSPHGLAAPPERTG